MERLDPVVLDVRVHDYTDPVVAELVEEVQGEYVVRYGDRDLTPVDPAEFRLPRGFVLVGWCEGVAVGSVAMRAAAQPGVAEMKRLYVRASHRRRGLARLLLHAAEDRAREAGYTRIVLETGVRQPEAIALYETEGYTPVAGFGYYADMPSSRYFGLDLTGSRSRR
ncbi:N-acetyltransferase [Pseudonocardia sulfidoxydans NBRC 16205]|uniref:N-acetyltransferase n=1 Tax=Pseudonocardia sulfidoxydans NBRC 16205 TaxID=1223511 RepID=A0A511DG96_9PSEU|nr:GNAT family N-acetyltransferase [Pseudonocardia sulfidoxydans]GEL22774.1 N-acetyltransferase [Pseudonocardia sulfidoxydans NBRC 16205]